MLMLLGTCNNIMEGTLQYSRGGSPASRSDTEDILQLASMIMLVACRLL